MLTKKALHRIIHEYLKRVIDDFASGFAKNSTHSIWLSKKCKITKQIKLFKMVVCVINDYKLGVKQSKQFGENTNGIYFNNMSMTLAQRYIFKTQQKY